MPTWPVNKPAVTRSIMVEVAKLGDLDRQYDDKNLHWLNDSELTRYQTISATDRKRQFLAGHFLVREMASRKFKNLPEDWSYYLDADNYRRLKCRHDDMPILHVSISHSGDRVAATVSDTPVGIDVETFSRQRDFLVIARHVLSKTEIAELESCNAEELKKRFYMYWTLKECLAKQYGEGIKFEKTRMSISSPVSEFARADMQSWSCPDFVVSLASHDGRDIDINGVGVDAVHQRWQNIPVN